ncbi:MAG: hypothetical protein RIR69_1062 [Actinomycetota bacterium]|jgi:cytochrome P450
MTLGTDTAATSLFTNPQTWGDMDSWEQAAIDLHASGPLHRIEVPGFAPFWAVIGHSAVLEVERHANIFHNAPRPVLASIAQEEGSTAQFTTLIHMDGQEHFDHRRLTVDWFKPATISTLQPRLDDLSQRTVQKMRDLGGTCDFATDVALAYPLQVILEILGLPESDYPLMLKLTQQLFGQEDPDIRSKLDDTPEARMQVIVDFFTYFRSLTENRRAVPTDDLATLIANGTINGEPLSEASALGYYIIIATAGHDTTSNAMSTGIELLAQHPDQLEKVQRQPELLTNAIEEIIRIASPVRHFMRTATQDAEVAGQKIKEGERLYLSYKAANLDPTVFDNPRVFDVERPNANKNVSFGYGVHFCLGAQLARNEIRSLFGHLIPRLTHLELAGPTTSWKTTFVGGPKNVPITYALAAE